MITAIVRFKLPADMTEAKAAEHPAEATPRSRRLQSGNTDVFWPDPAKKPGKRA